ncbi:MAG: tetratricopeptide repeat protein [Candidatus Cybelea sp.]
MDESLAALLRGFRTALGISQEALAERCGLSTRAIGDIETGAAHSPRLVTLMLISDALGLSKADRTRLQDAARMAVSSGAAVSTLASSALHGAALEGRDADVARLSALLARADARLVTLVGPAGVGKTSLARRVAIERAQHVADGAAIVELASIKEPSLVPAAVARALGLRQPARNAAREAVANYLRECDCVLILDNLEHLRPAARWIGALVSACPRLTVLATSRERLHLAAEHVYAVGPLASDAAVRLFVQRAKAAKPEFELTEANAAAVATIVEHLEGLPLAIELAAPRLLLLPPNALAARLERRLPLLADGALDRPERQQTMQGAIAWSYDLLTNDERSLFERLSVLAGGGTLEAAAAVAGSDVPERSILARLAPLAEKNMLVFEDAGGQPRVAMLEMLREFAQDRLARNGELAATQRSHAAYVLRVARRGEREFYEREYPNVQAALEWAAGCRELDFGFQLIGAIWRFWQLQGRIVEGLDWISRFLRMEAASPNSVSATHHAAVLHASAALESALGNFQEALASYEQAIALQRALRDDAGLAASLASLGLVLQFRGEHLEAERANVESLEISGRLGNDAGVAAGLSNLALLAYGRGDLQRAAGLAEESAATYRRLDNQSGLANALVKIGLIAMAYEKYESAEELFGEALAVQQAAGDVGSMHQSLANLAAVAHRRGDHELSLTRFGEALDLLAAVRDKSALAKTLEDFAFTVAALDDPSRAARLLGAAQTLRNTIGLPIFPIERERHDAEVSAIRGCLGDDAFLVQWRIGISMTLERALDEARSGTRTCRPG